MNQSARSKLRLAASALFAAGAVLQAHAATPAASAPAAAAAPVAIDAEKQKLIDQLLTLWHPEASVVQNAQRPAVSAMERSRIALQQSNVPADKIDKTMKDIATDAQKYVDTAVPQVAADAKKALPSTAVPLIAQTFSNDELRQLIAFLKSPLREKFDKLVPQADQAVVKKVEADIGPDIDKQVRALNETIGTKLRAAITAK